jgi:hypothetical protein
MALMTKRNTTLAILAAFSVAFTTLAIRKNVSGPDQSSTTPQVTTAPMQAQNNQPTAVPAPQLPPQASQAAPSVAAPITQNVAPAAAPTEAPQVKTNPILIPLKQAVTSSMRDVNKASHSFGDGLKGWEDAVTAVNPSPDAITKARADLDKSEQDLNNSLNKADDAAQAVCDAFQDPAKANPSLGTTSDAKLVGIQNYCVDQPDVIRQERAHITDMKMRANSLAQKPLVDLRRRLIARYGQHPKPQHPSPR